MSWMQVDEGWGRKAVDYAYLFEAQMWPEYIELLNACGVDESTRMLDVACGPGLAVRLAHERGALVAAIDASPRLVAVARVRTPGADLRVGDMFHLPWPDAVFDVVTSFRGIWGGCEAALAEAVRVCRPGGRVGLSFWGNAKKMSAYPLLKLLAEVDQHDYAHAKEMANIAWEGVAERMMTDAGLKPGRRWVRSIPLEYPDVALAARAFASGGPAYLAIRTMGEDAFVEAARAAAEALAVPDAGVRFGFEVQFLVGQRTE
jgi:SAM-dependent methyltransferase